MESLMPQIIQDHLKFYDDCIIEEMRKGKSEQEVWNCSRSVGNCENHCRCK